MSPGRLTVSCARRDEELDALAAEWRELFAASGRGHVFLSPSWHRAWRAVFDGRRETRVLALRREGRLVGVQPLLQLRTRRGPALRIRYDVHPDDERFLGLRRRFHVLPVRQLSAPVCAESSNLRGFLLAADEDRAACEAAMLRHLAAQRGWDLGVFLCEGEPDRLAAAARDAGLQATVRPDPQQFRGIEVMPWEQYLAARPRAFRKNMRQAEAAGAALQASTFEGAAAVEARLGELFDVAARSWKASGREGERDHLPLTDRTRAFVQTLCADPSPDLTPLLVLLHQDGRAVAGALCLRAGPRLFGSLIYYDLAVAAASPGRHLMRAMMQWAASAQVENFDLNGESRMNQYFATHTVAVNQVMVFSPTLYGRLLHRLSTAVAARATAAAGPERHDAPEVAG
jgi:CelD/BcsL family acetyltransferase involved in cellulose biosynthesis